MGEVFVFILGGILGVLSKLFDIHTEILGNIFSELPIWMLLGTMISIYSKTSVQAMIRVFLFCVSMIITYYMTAELTNSIYGIQFIKGWSIFTCFTPILAYLAWKSKQNGLLSQILRLGIIGTCIFSSCFLFTLDIFDVIITILLIFFLYKANKKTT